MYLIKTLRILFMSSNKVNHTLQKMARKTCGCNGNELTLQSLHNLNSVSSKMGYKFNILPNPVKSASDKKDYR